MDRPPGFEKQSAQMRRILQEIVHDGPARMNALESYRGDHEARIVDVEEEKIVAPVYTEKWADIAPDAADEGKWTEIDLSGEGVESGDICQIMHFHVGTGQEYAGVRKVGSTLERKVYINYQTTTIWDVVADSSSCVEVYNGDISDVETYLVGYWRFNTS